MDREEIIRMAREALESKYIVNCGAWRVQQDQAITALRQALVDADDTSQERVDEIVKTEHDKQLEIAQAYERGWNAALAQQEPVAWISEGGDVSRSKRYMDEMGFKCNPLYTSPPQREWVGLTADEIWKCNKAKSGSAVEFHICYEHQNVEDFAKSIEAKLKERNG